MWESPECRTSLSTPAPTLGPLRFSFPGPGPPGGGGVEAEEKEEGRASSTSLYSFLLQGRPLPPGSQLPHLPLRLTGVQDPTVLFITPVPPTGSAKGPLTCFQTGWPGAFLKDSLGWSAFTSTPHRTLGASRTFSTPASATGEPLHVHCLQRHLAKATWMFFYFLPIHLPAPSCIHACIHSVLKKQPTVFDPVNIGVTFCPRGV